MIQGKALRAWDLLSGALLFLLGLAVLLAAFRMPMGGTYGGVANPWYASPAALPLLIGGLLILGAVSVVWRALQEGAWAFAVSTLGSIRGGDRTRRIAAKGQVLLPWLLCLVYAALLAWHPFGGVAMGLSRVLGIPPRSQFWVDPPAINYVLTSALFLFAFIWLYGQPDRSPDPGRYSWDRRRLLAGLGVSLLVPLAVGFLFSEGLRVPLP